MDLRGAYFLVGNATTTAAPNTTIAPHAGGGTPHDDTHGYCGEADPWFLVYAALGVGFWLLCVVVQCQVDARPTPGKVNWARPWIVSHLLLSILVWQCLPSAAAFFIFHTVFRDSSFFEDAARFTCLSVYGSPPYLGLFIGLQGVLLIVATRTRQYCETVAKLLWPEGHLQQLVNGMSDAQKAAYRAPITLMYGSASRGSMYLEVAKLAFDAFENDPDLRTRISPPRVLLADVSLSRSWVAVNADAMELPSGVVEVIDVGPLHIGKDGDQPAAAGARTNNDMMDTTASEMPTESDFLVAKSDRANPTTSLVNINADPFEGLVPLQLPLPDAYCDEVLFTPWIRKLPPLGSFVTDSATVRRHMQLAMKELKRTLRPGGRVVVIDGLKECISTEADLRTAGFNIVEPATFSGAKAGSVVFMQQPMFRCVAERPCDDPDAMAQVERDDRAAVEALAGTISAALRAVPSNRFAGDGMNANADQNLLAPGSPTRKDQQRLFTSSGDQQSAAGYSGGAGIGYGMIIACQLTVYLVLLFIAACLASPLNVPQAVVIDSRVASLLFSIAGSYPMMAYFSRAVSVAAAPTASLGALVGSILRAEIFATIASLALSALTYLPQLGLQYALSGTSLSDGSKTMIAIFVSILIGLFMYKRGTAAQHAADLKDIGCTPDKYKALEASGGSGCC